MKRENLILVNVDEVKEIRRKRKRIKKKKTKIMIFVFFFLK